MGISILKDKDDSHAVMYCNTTDWCFGPVHASEHYCAATELGLFIDGLPQDAREYSDSQLEELHAAFCGKLNHCDICGEPFTSDRCPDCEREDY